MIESCVIMREMCVHITREQLLAVYLGIKQYSNVITLECAYYLQLIECCCLTRMLRIVTKERGFLQLNTWTKIESSSNVLKHVIEYLTSPECTEHTARNWFLGRIAANSTCPPLKIISTAWTRKQGSVETEKYATPSSTNYETNGRRMSGKKWALLILESATFPAASCSLPARTRNLKCISVIHRSAGLAQLFKEKARGTMPDVTKIYTEVSPPVHLSTSLFHVHLNRVP